MLLPLPFDATDKYFHNFASKFVPNRRRELFNLIYFLLQNENRQRFLLVHFSLFSCDKITDWTISPIKLNIRSKWIGKQKPREKKSAHTYKQWWLIFFLRFIFREHRKWIPRKKNKYRECQPFKEGTREEKQKNRWPIWNGKRCTEDWAS